jgi:hypothetical protein
MVRLPPPPEPPGRNSSTRAPSTRTASPTSIPAAGAEEVKTKTASEVASSPSPVGSCIQKPLVVTAVTTPSTSNRSVPLLPNSSTAPPTSGDLWPTPWIAAISVSATSSFRMVPVPLASARVALPEALSRLESTTERVSSGSALASPFTVTVTVWLSAPPAAKVSVPPAAS